MRATLAIALAFALAAGLGLAGCGSDVSEPGSSADPGADESAETTVSSLAPGEVLEVMPVGDSITAGPYYRVFLTQTVAEASCPVDFVGYFNGFGDAEVPDTESLDLDHAALGGYTTEQVLNDLPVWVENFEPDVAMVYLGVNDFYNGLEIDDSVSNMEAIVGVLRAANPEITILLAQIMPAVDIELGVEAYNARLERLARRLDNPVSSIEIVDLSGDVVVAEDLSDGVHPTDAQSEILAAKWAPALAAVVGPGCEL